MGAVIKPDAAAERDSIIAKLQEAGFMISCQKDMNLSAEIAGEIYKSKEGAEFYDSLITHMTSGPTLMMVLSAENAVEKLRELAGPTDPEAAKAEAPESLRAMFGGSILENAIHSPSNPESAQEKIQVVFGDAVFNWDGTLANQDTEDGEKEAEEPAEEVAAEAAEEAAPSEAAGSPAPAENEEESKETPPATPTADPTPSEEAAKDEAAAEE